MPRGRPAGSAASSMESRPKGKMTAYAFFVQTCREEHKRKHPEEVVVFVEFSRKCADRWKTMTEKEKKRFNQMAEEDKKRFQLEMDSYAAPGEAPPKGAPGKRGPKRKKKLKDPNAPKRCMSAFFWYSQDERSKVKAANPDFGVGDIAKELGRRWSEVNEVVRAKYDALAEKDRGRYDRDKKAYQQKLKDEANGVLPAVPAALPTMPSAAKAPSKAPSKAVDDSDEEVDEEEDESE